MLRTVLVSLAVVLAHPVPAMAQADIRTDVTRGQGTATATGRATVTATITAINAPRREVTLKTTTGRVVDMTIGEEARNFDQLRVGDIVTVEYTEALTLSLKKGAGAASAREREIAERAQPGAKPGGRMGREVTVVAQVVAVDKAAKTVTLKGPKGRVVDLMVEDPAQLNDIKPGDRVEAVYTEAVAVSVVPGAKP
ncbi:MULTISPECIES: hypothetical protein [unclassified Cupriavidus]|uniref:hypothetical protein n=1 Tax=Cupriavidus sp. H19C3 TaxID=3241603 RepID=UPI003BF8982A